jgi:hypothetical protein
VTKFAWYEYKIEELGPGHSFIERTPVLGLNNELISFPLVDQM